MSAVKPEDDFQGYMEGMEARVQDELEMDARLERHRVWRETSWAGFAVRQMQAVGDHFSPFFMALASLMKDDSSAGSIAIMIIIRLLVILFAIGLFYVGAWLVQTFIGQEYVIEEEVLIVEEEEEEEEEESDEGKKKDQ